MAPKIKQPYKGKSKSKGKSVTNRFVNDEARKRYEAVIQRKDKGFIPERGLTATQALDWSRGRRWDMFMRAPEVLAVEPLVREFYANFPECQEETVFVRGEDVPFSAKDINNFYNLPEIFNDQYVEFKRSTFDDGIILPVIAKPGQRGKCLRNKRRHSKERS